MKYKELLLKFCCVAFLGLFPSIVFAKGSRLDNVDFGLFPLNSSEVTVVTQDWAKGALAFNSAPELIPTFIDLQQQYQIKTTVETGTSKGFSTVAFSLIFDNVHTIEIIEKSYLSSKERLEFFSNVVFHLGSSEKVLSELLPSLEGERVLFYLDAHWQKFWPLRSELEEISKTHRDNCIVVIDDFKVPNRKDIPYDVYKKKECSYEYIQNQLDLVFSDYTYFYLIPEKTSSRAKFVAIPKTWKN